MKESIYIFSNGRLKRKDNSLLFETENGDNKFIPVENIKEIFAFGEIDLNVKVLNFLTQKEIIFHYFNYYGYYSGSFYPREHYNSGYMILKQTEAYLDQKNRFYLAKKFIEGAAKNCLKILKYYDRREKDLNKQIKEIEQLVTQLSNYEEINQIMAIEGQIKSIYYSCFDTIINNDDFVFDERTKRPPKNHLNALISFSNSLIYTYCLSEIYKTHLDPRIGFLHTTNFRRFSLNLDIAEIFKPIIGDRTIFSMINKNVITYKDFEQQINGIVLNDKGRKKFLEALEDRLKQTIKHSKIKNNVSYRRLIRIELYKLEKHLMDEEKYEPFIMDW
ncbi:type I-B CRISPR-associated endonuclease Cas1b [Deferribacterales bacterium Es71-Z0220]|jgi:CRISPR-associated protein Cas1|uniref:type I-B CRISPR-associated endonuclease Cas1b n=1 Tax=Deferrivibrio essentukiensis TaxID=2880922 RepID=UPI001F622961|nr:type I-B CRISPR-associated endonuclease Cas1b [Deferrivibrio essentukiensis]MCB4205474.1 type I-B CRISPR-associated endonuclease Cas1b [Deferrivibrio essentukiensis]